MKPEAIKEVHERIGERWWLKKSGYPLSSEFGEPNSLKMSHSPSTEVLCVL